MKTSYRKSKNIEDLRDKPMGPKGVLRPTKAKKAHEAKAKLIRNALDSDVTTRKKSIKTLPDTDNTYNINVNTNNRRTYKGGVKLGSGVKNKDLDSKQTSFKTTEESKNAKFKKVKKTK